MALKYLDDINKHKISKITHFYYRERAKALYYLGQFEEALENIKLVDYPEYVNHRFDYLMMWSSKVYEGYCSQKQNISLNNKMNTD